MGVVEIGDNITSVEELLAVVEELNGAVISSDNGTLIWILLAGFLVFFMHAGFTMLEVGSVRHKNAVNIMFKNLGTISLGAIFYFLLGFAFAYGEDNITNADGSFNPTYRFIGSGDYALSGEIANSRRNFWFFQAVFAATAATIVSGAVAGRIELMAYFGIAAFLTAFVYPVISHWIWASGGWLSAFQLEDPATAPLFAESGGCGMIDYAGSGVVHMTGGVAAFWVALALGARIGRFDSDGNPIDIPPHNIALQTLGVFILWFGWYGFNAGSTLAFDGENASKVAVTTTLSPAAAVITGMAIYRVAYGHYDIGVALNCALGGLVSITAGCSTVPDWAALIIGIIGAFVYVGASKLMVVMKIDDPVDAVAVHGFCGIWGCLAVGIFATEEFISVAYGPGCVGNGSGIQFATQLIGVLAIIAWVTLWMVPLSFALKFAGVLRVSSEMEAAGLDASEHGGQQAFIGETFTSNEKNDPPPAKEAEATQAKTEGVTQV